MGFAAFKLEVAGELTEPRPMYYRKIHIIYKITATSKDMEKVKEAVYLSLTKYCGVHKMLSKATDITQEIKYLYNGKSKATASSIYSGDRIAKSTNGRRRLEQ